MRATVSAQIPKFSDQLSSILPAAFQADSLQERSSGPKSTVGLFFVPVPGGCERILILRRSAQLRHHPNQIGLPGGYIDPGETDAMQALFREAEEELGTDLRSNFELLGFLPPQRALQGFPVLPIVGRLHRLPAFQPSADEVSELHLVPWTQLASAERKEFRFNVLGRWRQSFLYETESCKVWGLTAKIISVAGLH